MNDKYSIARMHIIANSLVQMIMTAGISFATIHFERVSVMWFYLIPAILMNADFSKAGENEP